MSGLGIFGGTFNPIHNGHLRTAAELRQHLQLATVRLMPAARPPHRGEPNCTPRQRVEMVRLACESTEGVECDARELDRPGPSYTIDSLMAIREEEGPDRPLCLALGMDAAAQLDSWHRWRELADYANMVLVARPGAEALPGRGAVADWLNPRTVDDPKALARRPAGAVFIVALTPYAVSSTAIRARIAAGKSAADDLPAAVWRYICQHGLYGVG